MERAFYNAYQDDFDKMLEIALGSAQIGKLKTTGKGLFAIKLSNVLPRDFIAWARAKGYQIPIELEAIESKTQSGTVSEKSNKPKLKLTANEQRNKIAQEWNTVN